MNVTCKSPRYVPAVARSALFLASENISTLYGTYREYILIFNC